MARLYAEVNLLRNELVPLFLATAGRGERGNKIALATLQLLTQITWPMDVEKEARVMRERGDDLAPIAKLVPLQRAMLGYKANCIRPSDPRAAAMSEDSLLGLLVKNFLLPSITKPRGQRTEGDRGLIAMSLSFFRSLLAIRDPPANAATPEALASSQLQSKLILCMHEAGILEILLMLCSNATERAYEECSHYAMDCVYMIYIGTSAYTLAQVGGSDGAAREVKRGALAASLGAEAKISREQRRHHGSSRHSRFGTTVSFVDDGGQRRVARNVGGLTTTVEDLQVQVRAKEKRKNARRRKAVQEIGAVSNKPPWTTEAMVVVQRWADRFLRQGFQSLTKGTWDAIRRAREQIEDLDEARVRMMQVGGWFLEYFLQRRELHVGEEPVDEAWPYSMVYEWTTDKAFRIALMRAHDTADSKDWLEFNAAVQLWATLFRLADSLSRSPVEADRTIADHNLESIFTDEAVLDVSRVILSAYKSQSLSTLRAIIDFAYHMLRVFERFAQNKDQLFIRFHKKSKKAADSDDEDQRSAKQQAADAVQERAFSFDRYQRKLCSRAFAGACTQLLRRWSEFEDADAQILRVNAVMHRLAVKAGAPQVFFPKENRDVLRQLSKPDAMAKLEMAAPKSSKDTKKILHFVLRKFDKLPAEEKAAYEAGKRPPRPPKVAEPNREIMVKPGHAIDEQVGLTISRLIEMDKVGGVIWVKDAMEVACAQRREIIMHTDGKIGSSPRRQRQGSMDSILSEARQDNVDEGVPSAEAQRRFEDYELSYNGDEDLRGDASTLPELKLLLRLLGMEDEHGEEKRLPLWRVSAHAVLSLADPEDEKKPWIWKIPTSAWPMHLEADIRTIDRYLTEPLSPESGAGDLASYFKKVPKPRAPRMVQEDDPGHDDIEEFLERNQSSSEESTDSDASASAVDKRKGKRLEQLRKKVNMPKPRRATQTRRVNAPLFLQDDMIDDSDEELAAIEAAMAKEGVRARPRDSSVSSSRSSRSEQREKSSPPTSSPPASPVRRHQRKALFFDNSDSEPHSDVDSEADVQTFKKRAARLSSSPLLPPPAFVDNSPARPAPVEQTGEDDWEAQLRNDLLAEEQLLGGKPPLQEIDAGSNIPRVVKTYARPARSPSPARTSADEMDAGLLPMTRTMKRSFDHIASAGGSEADAPPGPSSDSLGHSSFSAWIRQRSESTSPVKKPARKRQARPPAAPVKYVDSGGEEDELEI